jgi:hypothetical protein
MASGNRCPCEGFPWDRSTWSATCPEHPSQNLPKPKSPISRGLCPRCPILIPFQRMGVRLNIRGRRRMMCLTFHLQALNNGIEPPCLTSLSLIRRSRIFLHHHLGQTFLLRRSLISQNRTWSRDYGHPNPLNHQGMMFQKWASATTPRRVSGGGVWWGGVTSGQRRHMSS